MKNVIIGTAGHIDHGKTTLIKALTGKDTDRLKEEKLRGMTTDLGFAYLDLPSGIRAGIIDVPGHEKFIKNMLAGAHGIDIVMMVIAADEGIMPQTVEHLQIISLLDVKKGVVVLTKADLVDDEWLAMVVEEVKEALKGTILDGAPIIPVSSTTGQGLDRLVAELDSMAQSIEERSHEGVFRLPIDRIFTVQGHGTVVTGTMISGTLKVGDEVVIYPKMIESRVRSIQVYGQPVQEAYAGQRTAVNLANVKVEQIERGDVIAPKGALTPSRVVDVKFNLLSSAKPIKNRTRIRFYVGASEVMGRVLLLDRDELRGGESCYAQMQLESFVCVLHGDRFVVRTYSPMETIGGGIVLVPNARKHKRFREQVVNELQSIEQLGKTFQVEKAIYDSGLPLPLEEIKEKFHISDKDLLSSNNLVTVSYGGVTYVYHKGSYEKEKQKIKELLEKFHRDFPLREGMSKEELKEKVLKEAKGRQFDLLLSMLESDGLVTVKGQVVALKGFAPALSAKEEEMKETILRKLSQSHLKPIKEEEIVGSQAELSVLHFLIRSGDVVKLPSGEYLLGNQVEEAKKILVDYLKNHGQITLASFRDLLGVSRRDALALLEYFDSVKVTKRAGDVRVLA
jgi:selenocysteine-specific elongation factor